MRTSTDAVADEKEKMSGQQKVNEGKEIASSWRGREDWK